MSSPYIRALPVQVLTPDLLESIKDRVTDGIALGGNYDSVFDRYVVAHNDRKALLARVIELEARISCGRHMWSCDIEAGGTKCTCGFGPVVDSP